MYRNIYLDNLKKDIKEMHESFEELYEDIDDYTYDELDDGEIESIRKRLIRLKTDILRISKNADELEEYITNNGLYTKVKIRIYEILSGLKILEYACKENRKEIYNKYLYDYLNTYIKVSDNIYSYSRAIKSDYLNSDEIEELKHTQNRMGIIKEKNLSF